MGLHVLETLVDKRQARACEEERVRLLIVQKLVKFVPYRHALFIVHRSACPFDELVCLFVRKTDKVRAVVGDLTGMPSLEGVGFGASRPGHDNHLKVTVRKPLLEH